MSERDWIKERKSTCEFCGCDCIHVDTTSGEIIHGDRIVADVSREETWAMGDYSGNLICEPCWDAGKGDRDDD